MENARYAKLYYCKAKMKLKTQLLKIKRIEKDNKRLRDELKILKAKQSIATDKTKDFVTIKRVMMTIYG